MEGGANVLLVGAAKAEDPGVAELIRGGGPQPIVPMEAHESDNESDERMLYVGPFAFPQPEGWSRGPLVSEHAVLSIQSDYHSAHAITVGFTKGRASSALLEGQRVERPTKIESNGLTFKVTEVTNEASPGVHAHLRMATLQEGMDTYMFLLVTSRPRRDEDVQVFDRLIRQVRRVR